MTGSKCAFFLRVSWAALLIRMLRLKRKPVELPELFNGVAMNTQTFFFRVTNTAVTVLCYVFYNPPVHVAMIRMLS
jgi:hypothetical protein